MTEKKLREFIDVYEKYYYDDNNDDEKQRGKTELGVSIIHPTSRNNEDEIMNYLRRGKQNINTINWKMGGTVSKDGIRTQYYDYPIDNINGFCEEIEKLDFSEYNMESLSEINIISLYDDILKIIKEVDLVGYGSVYIINSMFFLSKGNIPIYDYYANVAVKALLYDKCPQDIFVGQAPGKEEHARGCKERKLAVNMLLEYMALLKELANNTCYFMPKGEGYISRKLDRALWVYGHATEKWKINTK